MKKILLRVLIVLAALLILAVVVLALFLDKGIKKGIETVGPMLTKVDVKVDSVGLSLLSGGGNIKGLFVGNPEGFKSPSAIRVGSAALSLSPGSLLSDKVVIKTIELKAPEITFETDLKNNNLSKILANLQEVTGGTDTNKPPAPEAQATGGKKLQVDNFLIEGGKIGVCLTTLGGKSVNVPLPTIHLTNLGTGPDGITAAELTKVVLREIEQSAVKASSVAVSDLSKQAVDSATKAATDAAGKATKSVTDLFKKK